MKTITSILLMVAALNFAACSTTREQRCEYYSAAYTAYLVSLQVREPSDDEKLAAAIAGRYLAQYCGWVELPANKGGVGVPLVLPPNQH